MDDQLDLTLRVPARAGVLEAATPEARAQREQELRASAESVAVDISIFDEFPPFFWTADISTNLLDSYSTRMMPSSLKNYVADAKEGRAFLAGHNWRGQPWGYSVDARYHGGQKTGLARAAADFYTIPGLGGADGALTSDDMIKRIKSGILRDVSIGFTGGRWICSIDGADMMNASWDECSHYPGFSYEVSKIARELWTEYLRALEEEARAKKQTIEKVLCEAWIEDARLSEVSGVYDGATPGAMIQRALRGIAEGMLSERQVGLVEQRYRVTLPHRSIHAVTRGVTPQGDEMDPVAPGTNGTATVPAVAGGAVTQLASGFDQAVYDRALGAIALLRSAGVTEELDAAVTRLLADNQDLRPHAEVGRQHRVEEVQKAVASGVRAMADAFPKERWEKLFASLDIAEIRLMGEQWEAQAKAALPTGRQSADSGDEPKEGAAKDARTRRRSIG